MSLSSRNRRFLKSLAHPLEPLVRVGRGGLSRSVIAEADRTIESHELIKIRIDLEEPAARRTLAAQLAEAIDADLVGTVGRIAILYRERKKEPEIHLPETR